MSNMIDKKLLQKAIDKWGLQAQINKIQEEALELALVLNQINCSTKDFKEMEEQLYSELADMEIMMAQARLIFNEERINDMIEYKLKRLKDRYFK